MSDIEEFEAARRLDAMSLKSDAALDEKAKELFAESDRYNYSYFWNWCGLPVIQTPADIVTMQEIIWETKPDVIVELGVARGGSLILYSSICELQGHGRVVGVDIDIRSHNRQAIEGHALAHRITLIEGSSVDRSTAHAVRKEIGPGESVMVVLDSNHTHEHVLGELRLYAPMVTPGKFLVVADTIVEFIPPSTYRPRPWGPGNNPQTALDEYLRDCDRFEVDEWINSKLLLTNSPGGYLRCVKAE